MSFALNILLGLSYVSANRILTTHLNAPVAFRLPQDMVDISSVIQNSEPEIDVVSEDIAMGEVSLETISGHVISKCHVANTAEAKCISQPSEELLVARITGHLKETVRDRVHLMINGKEDSIRLPPVKPYFGGIGEYVDLQCQRDTESEVVILCKATLAKKARNEIKHMHFRPKLLSYSNNKVHPVTEFTYEVSHDKKISSAKGSHEAFEIPKSVRSFKYAIKLSQPIKTVLVNARLNIVIKGERQGETNSIVLVREAPSGNLLRGLIDYRQLRVNPVDEIQSMIQS